MTQKYLAFMEYFDKFFNEDGDFDITNNTNLVSGLYMRKQSTYHGAAISEYLPGTHGGVLFAAERTDQWLER